MDSQFAFFTAMRFDEKETFATLTLPHPEEEQAAKVKGTELPEQFAIQATVRQRTTLPPALKNRAREIPNLISPHLGDRAHYELDHRRGGILRASSDGGGEAGGQCHCALPSWRTHQVDPWDDQLRMLKSKPVGTVAESEKVPFEVTPFIIYLTRQGEHATTELLAPCQPRLIQKQTLVTQQEIPQRSSGTIKTKTPHFSRFRAGLTFRETMGQFRVIHESSPRTSAPIFWSPRWAIGGIVLLLRGTSSFVPSPGPASVRLRDDSRWQRHGRRSVKLKAVARIAVGPGLSGMREHPTARKCSGSAATGRLRLDARSARQSLHGQVTRG